MRGRGFEFKRFTNKESHVALNEILKLTAIARYGNEANAVVNVKYEDLPGYDVSATGVAVKFSGNSTETPHGSAEVRLKELQRLFNEGAISRQEYDDKRAEILQGL